MSGRKGHRQVGPTLCMGRICHKCKLKEPTFNLPGKPPQYCGSCKKEGMVNVKCARCAVCKLKQPNYNLPGVRPATHCAGCATDGMIDVMSTKCIVCGVRRPTFNIVGSRKATHCGECKTEEMVDVKNRKCIVCHKTVPCYNFPDQKRGSHCRACKLEGMIDVRSTKCVVCHVNRPIYNLPGLKETHCRDCKTAGMINVKTPKCMVCKVTVPVYNTPGEQIGTHCSNCKLPGMVDVRNKTCKSEWCGTYVTGNKYDGYCLLCTVHLFPDKQVSRNYKTKETSVAEHITAIFDKYDWVLDKKVADGCSRRRPDLLADFGSHVVIVEIDENMHRTYDCSCNNRRIMELVLDVNPHIQEGQIVDEDIGCRPIVFIRFNPDRYCNAEGKAVPSCWTCGKDGIVRVTPRHRQAWRQRLLALTDAVSYWSQRKPEKMVEVVQLYYDQNLDPLTSASPAPPCRSAPRRPSPPQSA